ncbi:ImmA/IrrE family metallo-endopeptidase [Cytobacillus sp. Hm23]
MRKIRAFSNGLRNGAWSEQKFTNLTPYSPYSTEIYKIVKENTKSLNNPKGIFIKRYHPINEFFHPINEKDIKKVIDSVPSQFLSDLRGIFLCGGTHKQQHFSELRFGTYHDHYKAIFLFPFPKTKCLSYNTKPKPSIRLSYERHGATWIAEDSKWRLQFDEKSIHSFYLNDVLFHELGHHVENISHDIKHKNYEQRERFAEWFALEFGIKGRGE